MRSKTFCKECAYVEKTSDPMNVGQVLMRCVLLPPTPVLIQDTKRGLMNFGGSAQPPQMTGSLISVYPVVSAECYCYFGEAKKKDKDEEIS